MRTIILFLVVRMNSFNIRLELRHRLLSKRAVQKHTIKLFILNGGLPHFFSPIYEDEHFMVAHIDEYHMSSHFRLVSMHLLTSLYRYDLPGLTSVFY